jgi:purine-nucleoside phosphorylase
MATPHNAAEQGDFAKTVLMPGDPKRAELFAQKYLENPKLVNDVRGILAYTGTYKGHPISIMASGMGMPSMGIYCYELYTYYGVENIIRIGSCGGYTEDLELFDLAVYEKSYTEGNFALALNNVEEHLAESDPYINEKISEAADKLGFKVKKTNVLCSEVFDWYNQDIEKFKARIPKELHITCAEMESFALFYTAKVLGKKAACIATVVDSQYYKRQVTAEERQNGVNQMVELALEAAILL